MSQITVLDKNNSPTGPFSRAEIAQKLQRGEIAPTDLAFVEGLSEWTPLQQVLAKVDSAPLPGPVFTPPPVAAATLSNPAPVSPPSTAGYSYAATMAPPAHLVYGGFWLRFVAYLLDTIIVGAAVMVVSAIFGFIIGIIAASSGVQLNSAMSGDSDSMNGAAVAIILVIEAIVWVITILALWLYFAKLESGPNQATIGKRVLGLQVTDMAGGRISFARASGRFFGKIISALPLDIGFIMAAFTERKQALHDMIAGTLVVRK